MACGGLKILETQIDQKLLSNHHSVRVTDFAFEARAVAEKKPLKNGNKCGLKIGIHTGDVISGVVGETKPQFSLIGETVNKTARVCSKCPEKQILTSKETHAYLEKFSNNFGYRQIQEQMKGIGLEKLYVVKKKDRRQIANKKFLPSSNLAKRASTFTKNFKVDSRKHSKKEKEDPSQFDDGSESFRSQAPEQNYEDHQFDTFTNEGYDQEDDEIKSNEVSEDEDDANMLQ